MKKRVYFFLLLVAVVFSLLGNPVFSSAEEISGKKEDLKALNEQIIEADEKQDLPAAVQAAEEAVRVAQKEFGVQSLQAADAMNNLANLYLVAQRAPEAQRLFQAAILIDLEKLDAKSVAMADIYYNLGVAYAMQKKYKAATDILRKARDIYAEKQGVHEESAKRTDEMISELTRIVYPEEERL